VSQSKKVFSNVSLLSLPILSLFNAGKKKLFLWSYQPFSRQTGSFIVFGKIHLLTAPLIQYKICTFLFFFVCMIPIAFKKEAYLLERSQHCFGTKGTFDCHVSFIVFTIIF